MASKQLPIVAIVGQANVGKSSLFNAILKRREAIVASEPGTTRDAVTAIASYAGKDFWLVDTAGMKDPEDDFEFTIQEQIAQAVSDADIIWLVLEADTEITDEDRRIAKLALKSRKPVMLVVNKLDKAPRKDLTTYNRLGIKMINGTSVTQMRGIEELLQNLSGLIPKVTHQQSPDRLRLALLGRPNVGKSQLFNTLAKKQQAIVADRAGTTRDVNRATVRYEGREVELLDTAGIRRSGKIERGVEKFSVLRALSAIEEADVCLVLLDVNEIGVQLDQKIAGLVKEAGKGLILVVSKWDSTEKTAYTRDELAPVIQHEFVFVPWAPLIFTSAVTGQNVTKLFDLALQIVEQRQKRVSTPDLNRWLRLATELHPPAGLKNRSPKLNYITQETGTDLPSFKVFGSQTKFLHWSYKRYLDRQMREAYDFSGTPIKLWFIEKHVPHRHGRRPETSPQE